MVVEGPDGTEVVAANADAPFERTVPRSATVTLLSYDRSLANLGLTAGLLETKALPSGAALPATSTVSQTLVDDDGVPGAWTALPRIPTRLDGIRLAVPTGAECLEAGGCHPELVEGSAPLCSIPCPAPSRPEAAALPVLGSLEPPPGWVATTTAGTTVWTPWAVVDLTCPDGQIRPPGEESCRSLGPCDERSLGDVGGAAAVYVSSSASPGGDGTASRPFTTLVDALAGQTPRRLALDRGSYTLRHFPTGLAELVGPCAEKVRVRVADGVSVPDELLLSGVSLEATGAIEVSGEMSLEGARVVGPLSVLEGGELSADQFRLDGQLEVARGASVTLGTGFLRSEATGLIVGGSAELERVVIWAQDTALHVHGGAEARGAQLALSSHDHSVVNVSGDLDLGWTLIEGGYGRARGIYSTGAAKLELNALTFLGTGDAAMRMTGGEAALRDSKIVVGGDPRGDGQGISITGGSLLVLERTELGLVWDRGIDATGLGTRLRFAHVVVRDHRAPPVEGKFGGSAVDGREGSLVTGHHLRIVRAERLGMELDDLDTRAVLEDVTIEEVAAKSDRDHSGLLVKGGADVQVRRLGIRGAKGSALTVRNHTTMLDVSDLEISGTTAAGCYDSSCIFGMSGGIRVDKLGFARVRRFRLSGNGAFGAAIGEDSRLELEDGLIEGHQTGIYVHSPASEVEPTAVRVALDDNANPVSVLTQ